LPPPKIQDHATCSNYSPMTSSNEEEDTDEWKDDEQGTGTSVPVNTSLCQNQQRKSSTSPKVN
jgi:hypothetical protein